jgi:DNA end-binding protein Ku
VLDLMAALEQSLESARQGGRASASAGGSASSRTGRSKTNGAKRSGSRANGAKATAGTSGGSTSRRTKGKRSRDYESWPKSRLADEARRRDIPGRSKMGRDELVEALQQAS